MVHVHGRSAATLAGPRPRPSGQIRPHVGAWAVVRGPEWAGCGPGDLQGRWAAAGAGRGRLAPPRADHRHPRADHRPSTSRLPAGNQERPPGCRRTGNCPAPCAFLGVGVCHAGGGGRCVGRSERAMAHVIPAAGHGRSLLGPGGAARGPLPATHRRNLRIDAAELHCL